MFCKLQSNDLMLNIQTKGCSKPIQQTNQLLYLIHRDVCKPKQTVTSHTSYDMIIGHNTIIYLLCNKSAVAETKMEYWRE